ncbi:ATP-binding protein [Actinoplanes sp. CA-030573]|uniref:ATP-binding protein n=1 Tax=Actinoplanes sp. CA-030573 TaxID=3239898 RepID=UPI003D9231EA
MTTLHTSVPYPSAAELCRWTLVGFGDLRQLRASLRAVLTETGGSDLGDIPDRMTVVATELATNALRHGRPPTVVRLLREEDRLILDVADRDPEAAPRLATDRPLGKGGLGLQLARDFALDVGWYSTDVTKHVWASFPS